MLQRLHLGELFELSDELVVLSAGKVYGPYDPSSTDVNEVGRVMLRGAGADE